jgi:hypothetical protein
MMTKASNNQVLDYKNRLAVMFVSSHGINANSTKYLKCSLLKLQSNLLPTTPADIFLWIHSNSTYVIPKWLSSLKNTYIMPIHNDVWNIPSLSNDSTWVGRDAFELDYYLTGRWRLTFSLDFAHQMGYKYHLQLDDDTFMNSKIGYNFIHRMSSQNLKIAVPYQIWQDTPEMLAGLAELTRYWLYITKFTPVGPLYEHLTPKSITGLTTDSWDRKYHPGYFTIIDLDFWFGSDVQDFLVTVLRTGRDVEGKWQEQGVINMIRLLFIPQSQVFSIQISDDIRHDRYIKSNYENWCRALVDSSVP